MSGVSTPCSLNDDEDLSLARLSIRRNTQSFHDAGDPRDWERAPASRDPSEPRATTRHELVGRRSRPWSRRS